MNTLLMVAVSVVIITGLYSFFIMLYDTYRERKNMAILQEMKREVRMVVSDAEAEAIWQREAPRCPQCNTILYYDEDDGTWSSGT